eukprot:Protomagalhaensia_sp_Gyna_25__310@NODE_1145_length_2139_cov_20_500476_g910_i0_p1_GENE_NODE_1145_length_2139_cov_20_500476_g910_i0NODE_1145_length_2139_cov_20_500476_g910_i0_p1_ORF_typecomplete_len430_score64_30PIN_6/PF17146_4/5_6e17PIN_6/PF17146_4/8_1e03NOB1_Zn_bind/PF08772_11/1_6e14Nudix_N_2/PF14803_6/1_2e02Nudix_N_2/PF14803_6/7_3_NODE_1145_length_2139_cov_20_500476_g910_i07902079
MVASVVIVDTGAILRSVGLFHPDVKYYLPGCVLAEVRDKQSRGHLETVSDFLDVDEPSACDIQYVKDIGYLSGDLPKLSAQDIHVMALAVKHQKQNNLPVRTSQEAKAVLANPTIRRIGQRENAISKAKDSQTEVVEAVPEPAVSEEAEVAQNSFDVKDETEDQFTNQVKIFHQDSAKQPENSIEQPVRTTRDTTPEPVAGNSDPLVEVVVTEVPTNYDIDDGEGEWISAENFGSAGGKTSAADVEVPPAVSCMTEDFAMQNILFLIGIPVITPTGKRITSLRKWAYVCTACNTLAKEIKNPFCRACGYPYLRRVPIVIDESGKEKVIVTKYSPNLRGTIFKPPKVLNGKKTDKTILLTPDMIYMGGRDREQRHRENQRAKLLKNASWDSWTGGDSIGEKLNPNVFKDFQVGYGRGNWNSGRSQRNRKK